MSFDQSNEEARHLAHLHYLQQAKQAREQHQQHQQHQQQRAQFGETQYYSHPQAAAFPYGGQETFVPQPPQFYSPQGHPTLPPHQMYVPPNYHPVPLLPFDQVQAMMAFYLNQSGGAAQVQQVADHQQQQQQYAADQIQQQKPREKKPRASEDRGPPPVKPTQKHKKSPKSLKKNRQQKKQQQHQQQPKTPPPQQEVHVEPSADSQVAVEAIVNDSLPADSPWADSAKTSALRSADGSSGDPSKAAQRVQGGQKGEKDDAATAVVTDPARERGTRGRTAAGARGGQGGRGRGRGTGRGRGRGRGRGGGVGSGNPLLPSGALPAQFDEKERARYGSALRQARQKAFEELVVEDPDLVQEKLSEARYVINDRSGLPNRGWSVNFRTLRKIVHEAQLEKKNKSKKKDGAAPVSRPQHRVYDDAITIEIASSSDNDSDNDGKKDDEKKKNNKDKHVYSFSRERFYKNREFQESVREAYFGMMRTADLIYPVRVFPGRQQQDVPRLQIGFAYEVTEKEQVQEKQEQQQQQQKQKQQKQQKKN